MDHSLVSTADILLFDRDYVLTGQTDKNQIRLQINTLTYSFKICVPSASCVLSLFYTWRIQYPNLGSLHSGRQIRQYENKNK